MIYSHCHIVHSAAMTGLNAGQVWRRVLGSKSSKSCSCGVGLRVSKEGFEFEFGRHSPRLRHCANRDNSPTPHLWHTAVFTRHHSLSCQFISHSHWQLNFDSELARLTIPTRAMHDCWPSTASSSQSSPSPPSANDAYHTKTELVSVMQLIERLASVRSSFIKHGSKPHC